jgi:hypothetical protein
LNQLCIGTVWKSFNVNSVLEERFPVKRQKTNSLRFARAVCVRMCMCMYIYPPVGIHYSVTCNM